MGEKETPKEKVTIMEQDDDESDMVCGSCLYNIRVPKCGDWGRVECYCALDNHYIGYMAQAYYFCARWRQNNRRRGNVQ